MKQINEKEIEVNGNIIYFKTSIKKIIEYESFFVVLVRERKEIPNNIVAYDYNGNEMWKINDIIKAKIPRGFDNMEKISEHLFKAYYELGIIYEIDLDTNVVLKEIYTR